MKKIICIGAPRITELLNSAIGGDYLVEAVDYTGRSRSRLIKLHYYLSHILRCDIVYFLYVSRLSLRLAKIAKLLGKKVVFHWLGTDVYEAMQGITNAKATLPYADLSLCYAPNLQEELKSMGVDATIYTISPDHLTLKSGKMPDKHAVLLSIPDSRKEFYGYHEMIEVIRRMPHVTFVVVRSSSPEFYNFPNVVFKGMLSPQEMDRMYDEISIVIRYPEHDGLSLIMMESTIKGKEMIYRFKHPFSRRVNSVDEICAELKKIIVSPPQLNSEASAYGIAHYSVAASRETALSLLKQLD